MEKIESIIKNNIKPDSKVNAIAVIEAESNIVYSTNNWNIKNDLEKLNEIWNQEKRGRLYVAGDEYIILECTLERIVGISLTIESLVLGFKDEERKILCRIEPESRYSDLSDIARTLLELGSKKPYMEPDASLGKADELKWATPRILLDDTNNLQELGLLKFGLSIEEAKVYLALLKKGKDGEKVGNLNEELEIKRTTIYRIIDRLVDKEWVIKLPTTLKSPQLYIARPLNEILDERIQQKEEELKILKSFRFIMGEKLENGWIKITDMDRDESTQEKEKFSFKMLGITGVEKDCGLLVFEYHNAIENNIVVKAALQLSYEKFRLKLKFDEDIDMDYNHPDLEDMKFVDTKVKQYLGTDVFIRFRKDSNAAHNVGDEWILVLKQVAIPVGNKINIIWGSEEKFLYLLENLESLN